MSDTAVLEPETETSPPGQAPHPHSREAAKDMLRFIACGSVDDGKSTLIGRLLYEAKSLFDDQLAVLEAESRKFGKAGDAIDFALLVDGLSAEREQGITIDVAYRFFETDRRKFIVADTPGHERYTRNMATGASTADLAVLLIDARQGILPQTRRHALILSRLGLRHIVLAVNKIDLAGYDETVFRRIVEDFRRFAAGLGFEHIHAIPLSARDGDNVAAPSRHMPWYTGPSLLAHLETAPAGGSQADLPFRMAVQSVIRPDDTFRGYAGLVASGGIAVGDHILVQPSAQDARVARIVTADGDLAEAVAGQSVVLTLSDHLDVGRGDLMASPGQPAEIGMGLELEAVWMSETPLAEGQRLIVKAGTRNIGASVREILTRFDVATGFEVPAAQLALNDIGRIRVSTDLPLALDPYRQNRDTGGVLLIEPGSFATLGIGMVAAVSPVFAGDSEADSYDAMEGLLPRDSIAIRHVERRWRSLAKAVSWRITGSSDTFVLAFLFTGSAKTSATISVAEVMTKTVLYYLHERIWTKTDIGRKICRPGLRGQPFRWPWARRRKA